jgi:hypothetical protein
MKNYIDQEIAYEIALLWIHNFVDYRNKDQLWIHESIPLYMQIIALNHVRVIKAVNRGSFNFNFCNISDGVTYGSILSFVDRRPFTGDARRD